MNFHLVEFGPALQRLRDNPLTLTARDFDVLREFGGTHPEAKAHEAVGRVQRARVEALAALETKALAPAVPDPGRPSAITPDALAEVVVFALKKALEPIKTALAEERERRLEVDARLRVLENVTALDARLRKVEQQLPTAPDTFDSDSKSLQ